MKCEVTAKRLRRALENANIIPAELSERSGVSQSSISQYLSGSHAPSNISSGKMASVLNCNPVWLMGFDAPSYIDGNDDKCVSAASANSADAHDYIRDNREQELIRVYRRLDERGKRTVEMAAQAALVEVSGQDAVLSDESA